LRYLEDLRACASVMLQVVMRNSSKTKPSGGDLRERERERERARESER